MDSERKKRYFRSAIRYLTEITALMCLAVFSGCGDEEVPLGPEENRVHGVWEGTLDLSGAATTSTEQSNSIRLELVQREFFFVLAVIKIFEL